MAALRELPALSQRQAEQLWRMVEYLRQKWPSFCSEYRRFRTATANEEDIAAWLRDQFAVVARYFDGRYWRPRAMPIGQCYLPTEMLGFDGMEVVLQGMSGLTVIDAVHGRPLLADSGKPPTRTKRASATKEALAFLRLLGANIGPRVSQATGEKTSLGVVSRHYEASLQWPVDAWGRSTGLADDWVSDEINWLRGRWDSWSQENQRKRSRALWRLIETVWDDLARTTTAKPVYYHYKWKTADSEARSSWLATLDKFAWVRSTSGAFRQPSQLIIDTKANRTVLGTAEDRIIGWPVTVPQAALALGIAQEPTADDALTTLALLPASGATT